jgi:hypothetical protein
VSVRHSIASVIALVLLLGSRPAPAETADLAAARRAFERGQRAQVRGAYLRAAGLFELADDTAPTAAALRSAIRNWDAAGNAARAATLALRALDRYPNDVETARLAGAVVKQRAPGLALLHARCAPACLLAVDAWSAARTRIAQYDVYLARGEHLLVADYGDGHAAQERIVVASGEVRELALQPMSPVARQASEPLVEARPSSPAEPAAPAPKTALETAPTSVLATNPDPTTPPPRRDRRLPPIAPVIGAGLTLGLGAVLAWSIADTFSARQRYLDHPSPAGYHDGAAREARMDGLIGGVAALGTATLVMALLTDWHGRFAGGRRQPMRAQRLWPQIGASAGAFTAGVTVSLD